MAHILEAHKFERFAHIAYFVCKEQYDQTSKSVVNLK